MSAPPATYALRPTTGADHDFVYALLIATARDYVTQLWGWNDEIQRTIRNDFERWFNPPESGQIVQVAGRDAGYLKVIPQEGELLLEMLMLTPELHGCGLGTAILTPVLADAAARGLSVVPQVLKVNPATRLYERLGFLIVEELPNHYVMKWPA